MDNVKIYPGVELGKNVEIGEWVVLGMPYKDMPPGTRTIPVGTALSGSRENRTTRVPPAVANAASVAAKPGFDTLHRK